MVIPFLLGLKHSFLWLLGVLVANCSLTSPTPRTVYQMLGMLVPKLALLRQSKTTLRVILAPEFPLGFTEAFFAAQIPSLPTQLPTDTVQEHFPNHISWLQISLSDSATQGTRSPTCLRWTRRQLYWCNSLSSSFGIHLLELGNHSLNIFSY